MSGEKINNLTGISFELKKKKKSERDREIGSLEINYTKAKRHFENAMTVSKRRCFLSLEEFKWVQMTI